LQSILSQSRRQSISRRELWQTKTKIKVVNLAADREAAVVVDKVVAVAAAAADKEAAAGAVAEVREAAVAARDQAVVADLQ
jgi:hypothetical protein